MNPTAVEVDGSLIRHARKLAGLRISDLATAVGVHPDHISHIELGSRSPSPPLFRRICDTLDLDRREVALPPAPRQRVAA